MEKKQFNFKNIKGMLSRDEMKQIKGGSGWNSPGCEDECETGKDCETNTSCPNCRNRKCAA